MFPHLPELVAARHHDQQQRRNENEGHKQIDEGPLKGDRRALVHDSGPASEWKMAEQEPGDDGIEESVDALLEHDQNDGGPVHVQGARVQHPDHRQPQDRPEHPVAERQVLVAGGPQTDDQRLQGKHHGSVGVAPQDHRIACHHRRHRYAPHQGENPHREHGGDAAEQEIDAEQKGQAEMVARHSRARQDKEKQGRPQRRQRYRGGTFNRRGHTVSGARGRAHRGKVTTNVGPEPGCDSSLTEPPNIWIRRQARV